MIDEQKAAFINSQVVCALIELAGMQAENTAREQLGQTLAYQEDSFQVMMRKYLIGHNDVLAFFNQ